MHACRVFSAVAQSFPALLGFRRPCRGPFAAAARTFVSRRSLQYRIINLSPCLRAAAAWRAPPTSTHTPAAGSPLPLEAPPIRQSMPACHTDRHLLRPALETSAVAGSVTDGYSSVLRAAISSKLHIAKLLPPVATTTAAAVALAADGSTAVGGRSGAGRGRCTAGGRPSGGVWVDSV